MKQLLIIFVLLITLPSNAQQSISLDECYQLVAKNYPLAKQTYMLKKQNELDTDVITTSKLPQISLDAQATYQSDVIEFPLAMSGIEPLNKDQYRATVSVNQLIYNGGATNASLNLKSAQLKTKQKQVEVTLYQLKQKINQIYFSVLLAQESKSLLTAKETQLKAKLKEVQSAIANGVALPASDKILEAEILKIDQQFQEIESNRLTLIKTLSSLISQPLNGATLFQNTLLEVQLDTVLKRPELDLFQLEKEEITSSENLICKQNTPKLIGFATGGYGNPGLNILDNSFQSFYTVGVKLNWKVFDWNSIKRQQESLAINKDIVDNENEISILS